MYHSPEAQLKFVGSVFIHPYVLPSYGIPSSKDEGRDDGDRVQASDTLTTSLVFGGATSAAVMRDGSEASAGPMLIGLLAAKVTESSGPVGESHFDSFV